MEYRLAVIVSILVQVDLKHKGVYVTEGNLSKAQDRRIAGKQ
jgi:hypothetical protein